MVDKKSGYIRYVTPSSKRFDPLKLAKETEKIVCDGDKRKYTNFAYTNEYGGVVTGHTAGCCLRCVFCWADWSRDFPEHVGHFYSPEEAFKRLMDEADRAGANQLRISGAEPTLCKGHLLKLLEYLENSRISTFILETNGMLFGIDENYVKEISKFQKVLVRISLKAGTPEEFAKKTGADPKSFEIPFKAICNLLAYNVRFNIAAVTDPRMMALKEHEILIQKLKEIDPDVLSKLEGSFDEEVLEPYPTSIVRLQYAGYKQWQYALPFPLGNYLRRIPSKNLRNAIRHLMYILFKTGV